MFSKKKKYGVVLFVIIIAISLVKISGKLLDGDAEQHVQRIYSRGNQGVIEGLQSKIVLLGQNRAILFVHGFSDSPAMFADLVDELKTKGNSDIYAPLLPFHGRGLTLMAQLNNNVIIDDLSHTINSLAKRYQSLTVVGMSYGGALLTALVNENKIPENVGLILYAPAFFIKTNTYWGRTEAHVYSWWRTYCNYKVLGCTYPGYASGDTTAKHLFDKEKSLQYTVIPALLQVYQFDLDYRKGLGDIHRPYSLIIAVDDNRVSYEEQKAVCEANQPYCHLYSFPSGKHIIHWGANKKKFEKLLIKLTSASFLKR